MTERSSLRWIGTREPHNAIPVEFTTIGLLVIAHIIFHASGPFFTNLGLTRENEAGIFECLRASPAILVTVILILELQRIGFNGLLAMAHTAISRAYRLQRALQQVCLKEAAKRYLQLRLVEDFKYPQHGLSSYR